MDLNRDISIQEEKYEKIQGTWTPVIPAKPIPSRPEPISSNGQENQSDESDWFPADLQGIPLFSNGAAACIDLMSSLDQNTGISNWEAALAQKKRYTDHIVGSYQLAVKNASASWNNIYTDRLALASAASESGAQRGSNNATGGPCLHICQQQSNLERMMLVNQNSSQSSAQINQYGFPVPHRTYSHSYPSRTIADAVSNGTISFQFAPVTPDKSIPVENNQPSKIVSISQDERLILEKNNPQDNINSKGNNAVELQWEESVLQSVVNSSSGNLESVLQTMVGSSSGAISTPLKENHNPEKGEENGIDLNKTPDLKPKRKKHRPRVVTEGKPKRTPKATIRQTSRKENPSVKRKYVRKNSVNISNTPSANTVGEITDPAPSAAVKSCKRTLNFILEGQAAYESHGTLNHQEGMLHSSVDSSSSRLAFNFNSESQAQDLSTGPNSSSGTKSTAQLARVEVTIGNSPAGLAFDLNHPLTQMMDDYISLPEKPAPTTPPPTTRKGPPRKSLKQLARNINGTEMGGACQDNEGHHPEKHQHIQAVGIGHAIVPTGSAYKNHENAATSMLQGGVQSICNGQNNPYCRNHVVLAEGEQVSGSKRGHYHTTDEAQLQTMNMFRAHFNSLLVYQQMGNGYDRNNSNRCLHFPGIYKKRRTEKAKNVVLSSTSMLANVGVDARQAAASSRNYVNADCVASQTNNKETASQFNKVDGTKNPMNGASNSVRDLCSQTVEAGSNLQVQSFPAKLLSRKDAPSEASLDNLQGSEFIQPFGQTEKKKKRSKGPTQVHHYASLTANAEGNIFPSTPFILAPTSGDRQGTEIFLGPQACVEALAVHNHAKMATKKRSKGLSIDTSVSYLSTDRVSLREHQAPAYDYCQSLAKSRGSSKVAWPFNVHIDEIIHRLNRLNINGGSNTILVEEQYALVPFGGHGQMVPFAGDGQMVPYEGQFDPTKKRKPRAKVDLDPESDRVWKLLMGKESINGVEGTDVDKEKWWQEERRVFHGRADSFIARMHLIQGDRRFSRWKGSVLDSVIGVFLTQNVSDHLSSSAFMSLAARFPLKPPSNNRTFCEDGTSAYVEEPEVCIQDSNDNMSREAVYNQGSVAFHEAEHMEERQMSNSHESFGSNREGGRSADISKSKQLDNCESGQKMCHELTQNSTDNMTTGAGCASLLKVDGAALEDLGSSQSSDVSSQNSVDSSILQKNGRTMIPTMGRANSIDTEDRRELNDIVSSPDSDNSSTPQTSERIRSCTDSSSEAEDPTKTCKSNCFSGSFTELLQMAGATMLQEYYNDGSRSPSLNLKSRNSHNESEDKEADKRSSLDTINGLKDSDTIHPSNSQLSLTGVPNIPSSNKYFQVTPDSGMLEVECQEGLGGESRFSSPSVASGITEIKDAIETKAQQKLPQSAQAAPAANTYSSSSKQSVPQLISSEHEARLEKQPLPQRRNSIMPDCDSNLPNFSEETVDVVEMCSVEKQTSINKVVESNLREQVYSSEKASYGTTTNTLKSKGKLEREKKKEFDWDSLRKVYCNGAKRERNNDTMDSVDWEAVRCTDVHNIAETIKERGMNNMLAERIKDFLNRIVSDHGSIDLEWLREVPPDKVKDYLLSVRGLGLKSVECVRLLTLHHLAFPVDTNVGRIAVRLGWVPLQPLPESLQLHLLELYPMQETIQKYLWPRLCTLDQRTLYELHYQMITFGKVFCTKTKPNCNACPMRAECKHFASAFASARLALPGPEEKGIVISTVPTATNQNPAVGIKPMPLPRLEANLPSEEVSIINKCEPIVEVPGTPEPESTEQLERDIEDAFYEDPDEIPMIKLNIKEFALNLQNYMQENNMELQEGDMSKALVALTPEAASIPMPKLKNVSRLRTEHLVYELPDSHPLLKGVDRRVPGDICSYLLAIWTPGETAESIQPSERCCSYEISGNLCNEKTCFCCSSIREANSQTVRGTLLIPCKTAMRGSFPLNGTYFQVNEVFADHDSSLNPIDVPRAWIWNLPRRTVFFGTSIPTIFKGQSTEEIQSCFWKGYVCVRGFDRKTRAPRPLMARFHFPASKLAKSKTKAT